MPLQSSSLPAAHSLTGEWRQYARFLRRPSVPAKAAGPNARSMAGTLRLLLLDFALMAALMAIGGIAYFGGVEFPENALETLEWTGATLLLIVLVAPIMEEVLFRAWLSGRPGHVLSIVLLLAGGAVMSTDLTRSDVAVNWLAISALLVTLIAAVAALWLLRGKPPMRWFARAFPVLFWLSALGFATIHIWNYPGEKGLLVFLLVIPQLIAGTIFGFARVRYGLWSAILLHMLHNGTAVTLALLTTDMVR